VPNPLEYQLRRPKTRENTAIAVLWEPSEWMRCRATSLAAPTMPAAVGVCADRAEGERPAFPGGTWRVVRGEQRVSAVEQRGTGSRARGLDAEQGPQNEC